MWLFVFQEILPCCKDEEQTNKWFMMYINIDLKCIYIWENDHDFHGGMGKKNLIIVALFLVPYILWVAFTLR